MRLNTTTGRECTPRDGPWLHEPLRRTINCFLRNICARIICVDDISAGFVEFFSYMRMVITTARDILCNITLTIFVYSVPKFFRFLYLIQLADSLQPLRSCGCTPLFYWWYDYLEFAYIPNTTARLHARIGRIHLYPHYMRGKQVRTTSLAVFFKFGFAR